MTSLQAQLDAYAAYHQDLRNKLTHFIGVPLVTFSIFVPLAWFRLVYAPDMPFLNGATVFYLIVFLYYLSLDRTFALLQVPFSLPMLWLADRVALWPFTASLAVFGATFVGGWVFQLAGHALEGRRPALTDNLLQIFNAPLFLLAEVLVLLGQRQPSLVAGEPSPAEKKAMCDV